MRIELYTEGGQHFDTLVPETGLEVWRSTSGDVVDLSGEQDGRLLTLRRLLERLANVDVAETGRPNLRVVPR